MVFFKINEEHTQSGLPQKKQRYISETISTHSQEGHRVTAEIVQKRIPRGRTYYVQYVQFYLYLEKCRQDSVVLAKSHVYRTIFNTEFNLDFDVSKKNQIWS